MAPTSRPPPGISPSIALLRETGRTEPELAAGYIDGRRRGDQACIETFSAWLLGTLRQALRVQSAVDIYGLVQHRRLRQAHLGTLLVAGSSRALVGRSADRELLG
ncbi:hypothetical protein ACWDKQ_08290 [Saccharopolyspora sp. NPDC000995]